MKLRKTVDESINAQFKNALKDEHTILEPTEANALEVEKERKKEMKDDFKESDKAAEEVVKATAPEEKSKVKDRAELSRLISEAKQNNKKFRISRCIEEGYRYLFEILKDETDKKTLTESEECKDCEEESEDIIGEGDWRIKIDNTLLKDIETDKTMKFKTKEEALDWLGFMDYEQDFDEYDDKALVFNSKTKEKEEVDLKELHNSLNESKKDNKVLKEEKEYLSDKVTKVLDDYGILYGDIVENGDGSVNIVGVDEEEWDEVVESIKAELGLDVLVPDSDHAELDNELIVRECLKEGLAKDTITVGELVDFLRETADDFENRYDSDTKVEKVSNTYFLGHPYYFLGIAGSRGGYINLDNPVDEEDDDMDESLKEQKLEEKSNYDKIMDLLNSFDSKDKDESLKEEHDKYYVYLHSPAGTELICSGTKEECEKAKAEKDSTWKTGDLWQTELIDKPIKETNLWDSLQEDDEEIKQEYSSKSIEDIDDDFEPVTYRSSHEDLKEEDEEDLSEESSEEKSEKDTAKKQKIFSDGLGQRRADKLAAMLNEANPDGVNGPFAEEPATSEDATVKIESQAGYETMSFNDDGSVDVKYHWEEGSWNDEIEDFEDLDGEESFEDLESWIEHAEENTFFVDIDLGELENVK